jgi:hypothetical protein
LASLEGFESLQAVGEHLVVGYDVALTDIDGPNSLSTTGGDLNVTRNPVLTNLDVLSGLGGVLRLTVPEGFDRPTSGTSYRVVLADSIDGEFASIALQEGLDVSVAYSEKEVTVTIKSFSPVSVEDADSSEQPAEYVLHQNYPNPFNPTTRIQYEIPGASQVHIVVLDALGRVVSTLVDRVQPAGRYETVWEASDVGSGAYFYRMTAGQRVFTKAMFLAR